VFAEWNQQKDLQQHWTQQHLSFHTSVNKKPKKNQPHIRAQQ
jgi:hypothetical protein